MQVETKMVDFLSSLYKKYRILNNLSQTQSQTFQRQITQLLIDENQNIQVQAYQAIENKIGFSNFMLDILADCIKRNQKPVKNQFQMQRNLQQIVKGLEKKKNELDNKNKILSHKEGKVSKLQNEMMERIREKCIKLQKESVNKIANKQTQIRKLINNSFQTLRTHQKHLKEKMNQLQSMKQKMSELNNKQKQIIQKFKLLEKKQKAYLTKENQINVNEKQEKSQCEQMKITIKQLEDCIQGLKKKLKNSQMAYKRKNAQINDKQQHIKQLEEALLKKNQEKSNKKQHKLDKLDLSIISQAIDEHQTMQFLQDFPNQKNSNYFQQALKDFCTRIILILSKNQHSSLKNQMVDLVNNFCQVNHIQIELPLKNKNESNKQRKMIFQTHEISSEQEDSVSLDFFPLQPQDILLKNLRSVKIDNQQDKISLITNPKFKLIIQECLKMQHCKKVSSQLLDMLLQIVMYGENYDIIITTLAQMPDFLKLLQQLYLNNQMREDIAEPATLVLSRIVMSHSKEVKLQDTFKKAISIRLKMCHQPQAMLFSNIKSIYQHQQH